MTASVLTEQCTRTLDGVVRPGRHPQRAVVVSSPSTGRASWCEDLWRKKNPELVGACAR